MTRLETIETRLAEIEKELNSEKIEEMTEADLDKMEAEVRSLKDERTSILKAAEKRASLEKEIAEGRTKGVDVTPNSFDGGKTKMEERTINAVSMEYRNAWLKNIRGLELNDIEKRAMTTVESSMGAVIPTMTLDKIVEKVHQFAPLLDKIDLLNVKGNVTVPAEGTTTEAKIHAQGAAITSDDDKTINVTLGAYEITKLVTISKSVTTMSIDAFERWLVNKLGRAIANKITSLIISGTGSSQPQGVNGITWDETNSVTVAKDSALTEANVIAVVGMLNGGFDAGAEWLMSKKTFMADFYPLMNKSKNITVTWENGKYYVQGYEVTMDERVPLHEAFLGNFYLGYIGNMQEEVNVTSQFVTRENSFDFLGCAMFDGKVQAVEAFVKIAKATA